MDVIYVKFQRCELNDMWDFTESDTKTLYEAKGEPTVLDLLMESGKKKTTNSKKGQWLEFPQMFLDSTEKM